MALPLSAIPKPIAKYNTTLAADITSSATSLTVVTATDDSGNAISGVVGLTIGDEFIIGTKSGTSVTGCLRGVDVQDGTTEVTALKAAHVRGTPVVITDAPFLAIVYRLLNGNEGFPNQLKYVSSGYPTPTAAYDIATKAYVDAVAGGTPATFDAIVVAGNAGETVSAGQLLYFDTGTNNEWMKCDADTAASVDNVILGIAQGAGTDGNAITSGVLLWGLDENQSGMTAGDPQFASNTAGAISSSAGTVEVQVGAAKSATQLYFAPRYSQQLTEDQQDALAGSDGTPSATNKYVTQTDAIRAPIYAATSVGTDAYAITPSPAITAYANGQEFKVKLDVANTGPCTLAVNGLSALAIVKGISTALVTGDLAANQVITVKYNSTGTVFQLVDPPVQLVNGTVLTDQHFHKRTEIVASRTMNAGNGTVNYAHGLGVAPKWVRITAMEIDSVSGQTNHSVGVYNAVSAETHTVYRLTGSASTSTTNAVYIADATSKIEAGVVSVDATNVSIAWTESGSPGATGILMLIECGV